MSTTSTTSTTSTADALAKVMAEMPALVVAVSGGVDSLALMAFAHRQHARDVEAVHAVSPAVPPASTARVKALAQARGWQLRIVDAGETSDDEYLANPLDRCRVCKSHLYDALTAIAASSPSKNALVVSGTNLDDLDDYRPGLQAAAARGVRHPFVEARIDKRGVRALARELDLGDVAELPAQPCLASRVETGIRIDAPMLRMIDDVENAARTLLGAHVTVRSRVRAQGMVLEIDEHVLASLNDTTRAALLSLAPRASLAPYKMGSAFLRVL